MKGNETKYWGSSDSRQFLALIFWLINLRMSLAEWMGNCIKQMLCAFSDDGFMSLLWSSFIKISVQWCIGPAIYWTRSLSCCEVKQHPLTSEASWRICTIKRLHSTSQFIHLLLFAVTWSIDFDCPSLHEAVCATMLTNIYSIFFFTFLYPFGFFSTDLGFFCFIKRTNNCWKQKWLNNKW